MQRIRGQIQNYAWGTSDAISELLGLDPDGEPHAEYWLGAHPAAPSTLDDGRTLDTAIAEQPDLLGEPTRQAFGDRLPFLLKVLSAAMALSLQSHPSRSQAEAGHAREEAAGIPRIAAHRNYKDNWPKPEAIVAQTPFSGLCGFRSVAAARAALVAFGAPSELVALLDGEHPLATAFFAALELGADQVDAMIAAAQDVDNDDARTVTQLAKDFPGDPGIVAALLLNRVDLSPGEGLFLGAGNMHAYLSGTGIEIMANSDNVLRGGLTPKHIDVTELRSVVDFSPIEPTVLRPFSEGPGVFRYPTPAPEFALWSLISPDAELPAGDSARILLVTKGTITLHTAGDSLEFAAGQAAFLAAGEAARAVGAGTGFLAASGV